MARWISQVCVLSCDNLDGRKGAHVVLISSSPRCKDTQEAFNVLFAHFLGVCNVVSRSVCAADTQYMYDMADV